MTDDALGLPHGPRKTSVPLSRGTVGLWVPIGTDAMLDRLAEAPPDPDDKMPYWADLWPSAIAMAEAIDEGLIAVEGRSVLELGAGLGLVSVVAARAGGRVRATDWDDDALAYIRANAAENQVEIDVERLDWRRAEPSQSASTILAADVLYERRNVDSLVHALAVLVPPEGVAWVADPGRINLPAFVQAASRFTFAHAERRVRTSTGATAAIQLLCLRKRR